MAKELSVVVVHPQPKTAVLWAQAFEGAGFRTIVNDSMIGAIGAMRRQHIDAIVVLSNRADITRAEGFLADGEDLPLCVVVGGGTEQLGLRSRSVMVADSDTSPGDLVPCIRTMVALVVPDDRFRTLPLRAPGGVAASKFTAWLTGPTRTRAYSAWH